MALYSYFNVLVCLYFCIGFCWLIGFHLVFIVFRTCIMGSPWCFCVGFIVFVVIYVFIVFLSLCFVVVVVVSCSCL